MKTIFMITGFLIAQSASAGPCSEAQLRKGCYVRTWERCRLDCHTVYSCVCPVKANSNLADNLSSEPKFYDAILNIDGQERTIRCLPRHDLPPECL